MTRIQSALRCLALPVCSITLASADDPKLHTSRQLVMLPIPRPPSKSPLPSGSRFMAQQ